jgi:hypothetical protein
MEVGSCDRRSPSPLSRPHHRRAVGVFYLEPGEGPRKGSLSGGRPIRTSACIAPMRGTLREQGSAFDPMSCPA